MAGGVEVVGDAVPRPGRGRAQRRRRCPRRRRSPRCPAAGCCPGEGDSGSTRSTCGDLHGLADARYAAEVCAAGGHHLLLSGPKGSGKTSLAERTPGILPDLTREEAVELTALHSLAGALEPGDDMLTRPPYAAPHHDASKAASGGRGAAATCDRGRSAGPIAVSCSWTSSRCSAPTSSTHSASRWRTATSPSPAPTSSQSCPPAASSCSRRTRAHAATTTRTPRPAGAPVASRSPRTTGPGSAGRSPTGSTSPVISSRSRRGPRPVLSSGNDRRGPRPGRGGAAPPGERYAGAGWRLNGQVPGAALRERWPLPAAQQYVDNQLFGGRLSQRGGVRVHRLAWTVADLAASSSRARPRSTSPCG